MTHTQYLPTGITYTDSNPTGKCPSFEVLFSINFVCFKLKQNIIIKDFFLFITRQWQVLVYS